MVPFAGYQMPVSYPAGILAEHHACRQRAALFDVSHMGQVLLSGSDAARALETLVPADIVGLALNQQRYGFFTVAGGGILDDIMITRRAEGLVLVVNASNKEAGIAHLRAAIGDRCAILPLTDQALLALQGPAAVAVMQQHAPVLAQLAFMHGAAITLAGVPCYATRSGYTGEDGFEISVPADRAVELARLLLDSPDVSPAGLGARDTLRLEAGLCLYGNDIDTTTTPIEAGLNWAIQKVRRSGGARAGGFAGADVVLGQLDGTHKLQRQRVALLAKERVPVREPAPLENLDGQTVGQVTSGLLSPTLDKPIATAYVHPGSATLGTELFAMVRGKPVPMEVVATPFVPTRYHRV